MFGGRRPGIEGLVMSTAFNLLHYPTLAQQQRRRHRGWTGSLGMVVGCAAAWGLLQWQAAKTEELQAEQVQLQRTLNERNQRLKVLQAQRMQAQTQGLQRQQLSQIAQHQHSWVAWHDALLAEAQRGSLRLERLQAQGDKLELQGFAPSVAAMTASRQHLADQSGQAVHLASWAAVNTQGDAATARPTQAPSATPVSFVWQAAWTAVQPLTDTVGAAQSKGAR